jgi:hypothetical protein
MYRLLCWCSTLLLVIGVTPVLAQNVCPANVLLSLARAGSACLNMENDEACYGGGVVAAEKWDGSAVLSQPGQRVEVFNLQQVAVSGADEGVSSALMNIQGDLPTNSAKSITLLLVGDAVVVNLIPPIPTQIVTANAIVNIRPRPEQRAEVIEKINITETLRANGITADGEWLRVNIPNTDNFGWITANIVTSDGSIRSLNVVDLDTPVLRPFQVFEFSSSSDFALCDGALPAGMLLQTPNVEQAVTLTINDHILRLAGTFFLRAEDILQLDVLEGYVEYEDTLIPAGARFESGEAVPGTLDSLAGLPLNNLPRRVRMPQTLTLAEIEEQVAALRTGQSPEPVATTEVVIDDSSRCGRETRRKVTLWAGPGDFYEAVNELDAGIEVYPTLQTTDPSGGVWYQLDNTNWIRGALVSEKGECEAPPAVTRIDAPPTNTLSLETCESENGPLRLGQLVKIQFRPQPFITWGEARDAVKIDPGKITVGNKTYRPEATEPLRLGTVDERYVRTFYIYWTATAGTYRIVGERLHYIPICSITVPVE